MEDSMFSGRIACFSPSVSPEIKLLWSENGGTIARSAYEQRHSQYYFCDGPNDPWLPKLRIDNGRVVFHAEWVRTVVTQGYRVAISRYVLDGRHDHFTYLTANETAITPQRDTSLSIASHHSQISPSDAPCACVSGDLSLFASSPTVTSTSRRSISKLPGDHSTQQASPVSTICSRHHDKRPLTISFEAPTMSLPSKYSTNTRRCAVLFERPEGIPHVAFRKESSGLRLKVDMQYGMRRVGTRIQPENSVPPSRSLPEDFWTSICLEACQIPIAHSQDIAFAVAIPVNKVLESLSERAGHELEMFRPGLVYKGKGFSCTERDRRKTI